MVGILVKYRAEKVELESEFNESKARCEKLLQKTEEDRHLWASEKGNLESNLAQMQTRLGSMASERELNKKTRELSTESEFLRAQLNENNNRMDHS